jgi:hypothetical protein
LVIVVIIMRGYQAYLLRLWHIKGVGKLGWRASLEDSHSGERLGFPNVEALIDYLRELVSSCQVEGEGIQDIEPRE